MIVRCLKDHPRLRLAIAAFFAIGSDSIFRMMRAKIVALHLNVLSQELFCHPVHERMEISFRIELSRDPRLVGDDDDRIPQFLGVSAEIEDARREFYLIRPIQIANFSVNNSISI